MENESPCLEFVQQLIIDDIRYRLATSNVQPIKQAMISKCLMCPFFLYEPQERLVPSVVIDSNEQWFDYVKKTEDG